MLLLAARRVNVEQALQDLQAGDPVAWAILLAVVFFSAFSAYRKYRAFSK
jgi:hypothetical protein